MLNDRINTFLLEPAPCISGRQLVVLGIIATYFFSFLTLHSTISLEQAVQAAAASQSTHDTRANTTRAASAAAVASVIVVALRWRVALLRVWLLLVLHRLLLVGLAAAVVILSGRRTVRPGTAHGRRWASVAALGGRAAVASVVWACVVDLGRVAGRRAVGSFVGHCGGVLWVLRSLRCYRGASGGCSLWSSGSGDRWSDLRRSFRGGDV